MDFVDANLYGVSLAVDVPDNAFVPQLFDELPNSYRYDRTLDGVGVNGAVTSNVADGVRSVSFDPVPQCSTPRLMPRDIGDDPVNFSNLARGDLSGLRVIADAMREYDSVWLAKIASLSGTEREEAERDRLSFQQELNRFEKGVVLLNDTSKPWVADAFRFMNEAMVRLDSRYATWRLFQIVFIVSALPGLAAVQFPDLLEGEDENDVVDVLWFAAGGGKSEAFFGVIVWQLFFDRLREKDFGVSAVIRFPLRLLTFQQLQRLANLLASAERIRLDRRIAGKPFSLGYFVGKSVTPNKIDDNLHRQLQESGVDPNLQRVYLCPFCREQSVSLRYEAEVRVIEHFCRNGSCETRGRPLPIYIVDDDIYRYLPSVIISTIDKLALFGQNVRFSNLFGRIDLYCERHGASFAGTNKKMCRAADSVAGDQPPGCDGVVVHRRPFKNLEPSLLVQDELHLVSQELGTFDAHYETAVLEMMRTIGAKPWKIIAATATIENIDHHVYQLYLRRARQFPGPGPEAYESFYYCQSSNRSGRIFLGLLGVGRKHTPAVTRALTLAYLELETARRAAAVDLTGACEQYNTGTLNEAEFKELLFTYELPLTYVLTRKGSDQVAEAIETRVRADVRSVTSDELRIEMFNGGVDVAEMMQALESIRSADASGNPSDRIRGLVTTNIIGHGVDVDRFNMIVFAGFTRDVSEYIQASARVGRTFPGLSIFVPTPQSERDRSVFTRFSKFHEYLDRLIDPSPINRWPVGGAERTLPGILSGYLMSVGSAATGRPISTVEAVLRLYGMENAETLDRDTVVDWVLRSYGADRAPNPASYSAALRVRLQNLYAKITNSQQTSFGLPRALNTFLGAMKSLRDVDDPAEIFVQPGADADVMRRLVGV